MKDTKHIVKTYQTGFSFCRLGAQGVGLRGAGVPSGSKKIRIFILLLGSCPRGGTWGAGGFKNFSVGICDGAPSTAHSSIVLLKIVNQLKLS